MTDRPSVLLIGVRPSMADALVSRIPKKVRTVVLSGLNCAEAEYTINDCIEGSGTLCLPSGKRIQLKNIIGTYSEGLFDLRPIKDKKLADLLESELTALVGYLRSIVPNCPNPPRNGSCAPFCDSLLSQWAFIENLNIGFDVPTWCLDEEDVEISLNCIVNPFDYRFPSMHQRYTSPVLKLEPLVGRRATCLFCGDSQWHLVQTETKDWMNIDATEEFSKQFSNLIRGIRAKYCLEVGSINYFFAGKMTYWSVTYRPDYRRHSISTQSNFFEEVCMRLTNGISPSLLSSKISPRVPHNLSRSSDPNALREFSHPLLEGYRTRISTWSSSTNSTVPRIDQAPSNSYVAVVSSRHDLTAKHLISAAKRLHRSVHWITYEGLAEYPGDYERVREELQRATGVFVRQSFSKSLATLLAQTSILADATKHHNVIAASIESTNWSKPLHSRKLAEAGMVVPRTAIRSHAHSDLPLMKGMGSLPTFAALVDESCFRFPLMLQEQQHGNEIRVHVVDDRVYAQQIKTQGVDYRRDGVQQVRDFELTGDDQDVMIKLARIEGLRFAGIDVIQTDGPSVVLEVNPMPGYHSYDTTGQRISVALLDVLMKANDPSLVRSI